MTGIVRSAIGNVVIGSPNQIVGWYNHLVRTTTIDPVNDRSNYRDGYRRRHGSSYRSECRGVIRDDGGRRHWYKCRDIE